MARARVWTELRKDPLLVPSTVGPTRIERILGDARIHDWWKDKRLRSWFLQRDAVLEKAEYLVDLWTDEMIARLTTMEDKNLVAAGKLLLELGRKMPERGGTVAPATDFSKLSPEELQRFLEQTAASCGLRVVPLDAALDVEHQVDDRREEDLGAP